MGGKPMQLIASLVAESELENVRIASRTGFDFKVLHGCSHHQTWRLQCALFVAWMRSSTLS
jgi:hypothetical protein